jgi:hypothetical protein
MRDSVTSLAPVSLFVISCWLLLAHLVTPEGGLDFGCRLVQVGVRQVDVQFFFGILKTKIIKFFKRFFGFIRNCFILIS